MDGSKIARGLLATKEKRLSLILPPEIHGDLKRMAAEQNTSIKELVIEAYESYLIPTYRKPVK